MIKILIAILLIFPMLCFAHPHVFIGVNTKVCFTETELEKIHFSWVFDDMTSYGIYDEFDRNGDEIFSKKETESALSIFRNMQQPYDYFVHLTINDSIINEIEITNFEITSEGICLAYNFDIYINYPLDKITNTILFSVYDEENYVKLILPQDTAYQVTCPECIKYSANRYVNYDISYYYDQMNPEEFSIEILR